MTWGSWSKWADRLFPYIEPQTEEQKKAQDDSLKADVGAIEAAAFDSSDQRALDEAQRVATAEAERVRSAESKATTYLAVMAALVPLVITLQAATWENKSGPAPIALKLSVLIIATIYVAAAGYHAFRTLKVAGFQRVGEAEIAKAWRYPRPIQRLTRSTLLASRRSRDTVNAKVTYIKVTHEHLIRAFAAFVLLLLLDPAFYLMGFRNANSAPADKPVASTPSTNKTTKGERFSAEKSVTTKATSLPNAATSPGAHKEMAPKAFVTPMIDSVSTPAPESTATSGGMRQSGDQSSSAPPAPPAPAGVQANPNLKPRPNP